MTLLVVYVALALGFSFMCSVLEAVLLSVTPGFIGRMKQDRPVLGARLERLKGNVDRPLSAILSLNTLANTAGAAGAGAQAQVVFGSDALAIASAILTLLVLVISEIIPKTLGAVYWRQLAPTMTHVLPPLIFLMIPFVWLSKFITRIIKKDGEEKVTVSREEIAALARLGSEQGVFDVSESRILANLFRFGSLQARDIMTPRTVMFSLSAEQTVAEVVPQTGEDDSPDRVSTRVFSRIPIFGESRDDVIGYVLKDTLFLAAAQGQLEKKLGSFARTILVVPEGLPVAAVFEKLLEEREHIALVVDEYGGVDGVVSMEDVLETLIGLEIVDEADATEDMREMARRRWTERREALGTLPPPPGDVSEMAASAESEIAKAEEGNS